MSLQIMIQETVSKNPGLHFRELQRRFRLGTGSLTHHLGVLEKRGAIKSERMGGYLRFYPRDLSPNLVNLIGALRIESFRRIVLFLMAHPAASHSNVAQAVRLAPSTISSHLMKLQSSGVLKQNLSNNEKIYMVSEPEKVAQILREYKESFSDRIVNRFCEMWGI